MDTFSSLPPEIRNMIYSLLLIQNRSIPICSPRRSWVMNESSTTPTANFLRLMLVNKQIHVEASTAFYSLNSFSIGNGDYGESTETNLHGLKSFIRRVPARYIRCITNLIILMYFREPYPTPAPYLGPRTWVTKYGIWTLGDASDLQMIGRAVVKHFKGVEQLSLDPCSGGPRRQHDEAPRLDREQSIDEIATAVKLILKHRKLEQVKVARKDDLSQLQEAVGRAVQGTKSKISVEFVTMV